MDPAREDAHERRCPRLGHTVTFGYCRRQEYDRLCPRIIECWWQHFDVVAFLEEAIGAEAVRELQNAPRPDKVSSLIELIEQAKRRREDGAQDA